MAAKMAKLGIAKDRQGDGIRYKYRGIDDVINALAPLYAENGLIVLPSVADRTCDERQNKSGAPLFYVTVKTSFRIVCVEDDSEVSVGPFYGEAMDSSDKATNKAMSAAYKYFAFQTFAIPTEADDADSETHEPAPRAHPPRPDSPSWLEADGDTPMPAAITECRDAGELRLWVQSQIPTVSKDGPAAKKAWFDGVVDVAGRLGVSRETVFAWCKESSKQEAA